MIGFQMYFRTQPYFYLQNVLGSTLYRVYTIPAGEIVPKTYLRSSRRIIIYRLQFLSTSCNYYLHPIIIIYTWRISLKFTKQGFLSCLVITVDDGAIFIHNFFYLSQSFTGLQCQISKILC